MSTSLPEKRIKKIQLPLESGEVAADKTYEIVPDKMQSSGYQATLPTLYSDSTIKVEPEWTSLGMRSVYAGTYYFGIVKPTNNVTLAWSFTYQVAVAKTASSYDDGSFFATVTVASSGSTSGQDKISIIAKNSSGSKTQTTTYNSACSGHCVYTTNKAGLDAGGGHIFGAVWSKDLFYGHEIKVRLLETINCSVTLLTTYYSANQVPGLPTGMLFITEYVCKADSGLQTYPILTGVKTEQSSYTLNLVGTYGTPASTETLYRSSGLSVANGVLSTKGLNITTYDGEVTNYASFYGNRVYWERYDESTEEYGSWDVYFPQREGVLGLEIDIVDLTNVN